MNTPIVVVVETGFPFPRRRKKRMISQGFLLTFSFLGWKDLVTLIPSHFLVGNSSTLLKSYLILHLRLPMLCKLGSKRCERNAKENVSILDRHCRHPIKGFLSPIPTFPPTPSGLDFVAWENAIYSGLELNHQKIPNPPKTCSGCFYS